MRKVKVRATIKLNLPTYSQPGSQHSPLLPPKSQALLRLLQYSTCFLVANQPQLLGVAFSEIVANPSLFSSFSIQCKWQSSLDHTLKLNCKCGIEMRKKKRTWEEKSKHQLP